MTGGISALQRFDRLLAPSDGLRIVSEGDTGISVAGKLGDEPHLDPLGLHDRNKAVPGTVWGNIRKTELPENRDPVPFPEVLIDERAAAACAGEGPGLLPSRSRENQTQLSAFARATEPPGQ